MLKEDALLKFPLMDFLYNNNNNNIVHYAG
jgi:hypothetical protein